MIYPTAVMVLCVCDNASDGCMKNEVTGWSREIRQTVFPPNIDSYVYWLARLLWTENRTEVEMPDASCTTELERRTHKLTQIKPLEVSCMNKC